MSSTLAATATALRDAREEAEAPEAASNRRFSELFAREYAKLSRWVRAHGVPPAAAEDVVQEVFVVVHRRLASFEPRAPITAWLYEITRRTLRDWKRREGRALRRLERLAPRDPDPLPCDRIQRARAADLLVGFLQTLDERHRVVFIFMEIDGMTAPEVAEALDVKLPTIYSRLRAARQRFADFKLHHERLYVKETR